ncbi:hypothetical protein PAHAL_3G183600 [Panicum hallii]|uniref:Uncharacterized protein n=1 Tax=Panicum hallii TaxID=206008 RepID=A0A2T8KIQ2_9POAL|nr:hypothetical protein PAHAL_3G183600 [Panicum hallii]
MRVPAREGIELKGSIDRDKAAPPPPETTSGRAGEFQVSPDRRSNVVENKFPMTRLSCIHACAAVEEQYVPLSSPREKRTLPRQYLNRSSRHRAARQRRPRACR